MTTYRELVYAVLDLLKMRSDDSYYTEEHILFLAKKMRALLLERKYKNTRNGTFKQMSQENRQQVCLSLAPAQMLPNGCGGNWLRSNEEVPALSSVSDAVTCTGHDLLPTTVTFIPAERMPYVGYNKWLKNIIYASRSMDGHLYLTSNNNQFMWLERVGLTGVFSDPDAAAALSHEACMGEGPCDIMDQNYPLEDALVPSCIELIVQELTGAKYAPDDTVNNDKDDVGAAGIAQMRAARPVEQNSYDARRQREQDRQNDETGV